MPMPGLKDNKLANSILTKNEAIYNQGLRGGELNPEMLKAYELNLEDQLQNRDALRSIVFDYESELGMFTKDQEDELSLALKNGTLSYDNLRETVVDKLVQARRDVFNSGKSIYNKKKDELEETNGDGFIGFPSDSQAYFDDQILTAPPGQEFTIKAANKKYHKKSKKEYILFKRDDGIYYYDKKDQLPSQAILLEKDNNLGIII